MRGERGRMGMMSEEAVLRRGRNVQGDGEGGGEGREEGEEGVWGWGGMMGRDEGEGRWGWMRGIEGGK